MTFDLNEFDELDRQEDLKEQTALSNRMGEIENELSLSDSPLWDIFRHRLAEEELKALNEMVSGTPEDMVLARERVKLVRHLASFEGNLRRERAQTEAKLAELAEFPDEGE